MRSAPFFQCSAPFYRAKCKSEACYGRTRSPWGVKLDRFEQILFLLEAFDGFLLKVSGHLFIMREAFGMKSPAAGKGA